METTHTLTAEQTSQTLLAVFDRIMQTARDAAAKTRNPFDDMAIMALSALRPMVMIPDVINHITSDSLLKTALNELHANLDAIEDLTQQKFMSPAFINTMFTVVVSAATTATRLTPTMFDDLGVGILRSIQPMIVALLVENKA